MMQNPFNGIETRLPSVRGVIRCVENPFNGIERKGYGEDEVLKLIEGEYERLMGIGLSRQSVL
jgi:hypothetical protein